jgi:RND family efflux transporter MFP subunit
MKNKISSLWAKKGIRRFLYLLVVVVLAFFVFGSSKKVQYETVAVTRGSVVAGVRATGQVKPKTFASLRFKSAGTVAKTYSEVGDKVSTGEVLASLDTSNISRRVTQAQADVSVFEVASMNAKTDIDDTKTKNNQALSVVYADAPTLFADVLNLSQQAYATFATFFDSSNRLQSAVSSPILSSQIVLDTNNGKALADAAMVKIKVQLQNFPVSASQTKIDSAISEIATPVQDLQIGLSAVINAVAAIPTGAVAASTLDSYKSALTTAQTNLNSALSKYTTLATDISDRKIQNTLLLNTAMASERTAAANLEKAEAALAIARQDLADATLRAPFAGTISSKGKQIGETVAVTDQMYYLLGEGGLEVVANIAEIDIAKLAVGNSAEIKLDAYGDATVFSAKISEIDPAETVVDGISTYRVKFIFDEQNPGIRSGMTADITIITARKEGVLKLPTRAVKGISGASSTVRTLVGEVEKEIPVKTGLRGSDSTVEILEGVSEGEQVILGTL